jgi:hypothetical protein
LPLYGVDDRHASEIETYRLSEPIEELGRFWDAQAGSSAWANRNPGLRTTHDICALLPQHWDIPILSEFARAMARLELTAGFECLAENARSRHKRILQTLNETAERDTILTKEIYGV